MKWLATCALAASLLACNANKNTVDTPHATQDSVQSVPAAPLRPMRIAVVWDTKDLGLELPKCAACSGRLAEFAADSCVRRAFVIEAHKDGVQYLFPTDGYAVAYLTVMR